MRVLVVLGTRPEVIKLWRVIEALKAAGVEVLVLNTRQSSDLVDKILDELDIRRFAVRSATNGPLLVGTHGIYDTKPRPSNLAILLGETIGSLSLVIEEQKPKADLVIVQGDTMTALAGALAAFYNKIPVAHVEAGLRTYNLDAPYPEEGNRQMIARIASLHFCPTLENLTNLIDEQLDLGETTLVEGAPKPAWVTERAFETGNTGLDALGMVAKMGSAGATDILVTFHRREAWDYVEELAGVIRKIAQQGHRTTWITHGNPTLRARVRDAAGTFNASGDPCDNPDGPCHCGAWHHPTDGIVMLCDPLGYKDFIRQVISSKIVITDSGGVVEECVSLGRKCIMVRDHTERAEALDHGHRMIGLDELDHLPGLVDRELKYWTIRPSDVFGDGLASRRIAGHIVAFLSRPR